MVKFLNDFNKEVAKLSVNYNTDESFREILIKYYPKWQESWMNDRNRMEKQYKEMIDDFDRIVPQMGLYQFIYYCCPADFIYWINKNINK